MPLQPLLHQHDRPPWVPLQLTSRRQACGIHTNIRTFTTKKLPHNFKIVCLSPRATQSRHIVVCKRGSEASHCSLTSRARATLLHDFGETFPSPRSKATSAVYCPNDTRACRRCLTRRRDLRRRSFPSPTEYSPHRQISAATAAAIHPGTRRRAPAT